MPANVNPSFDVLLSRAKAGDPDALGCLLQTYGAYLRVIAGSLLRSNSRASVDISDVVQETNLKACDVFATFQGSEEPQLVAWLRKILVNLVLNHRKKSGALVHRPGSLDLLLERACENVHEALRSPGSTPSAQASRREQAVLTANALESLPADYQQVLVLCYLDKVSHKEVGRRLGCSEGASRMLLMRAAQALEHKLRERA
jgi:RNA polymerase sigma-70 factor, ECF subfamily